VKERLEFILERPASESLLLFAEDFLARKFGCKKTSELTDVLRASSVVPVDELFRHNVEQGVANVYREQGFDVVETENWFWRTLFGLTFWKELFESPLSVSTEFDLIPECLIDGRFSELHQSSIDVRLDTLNSRQDYIEYIKAIAQLNAGVVNGLFVWRANLIDQLIRVLLKIELQPLKKVLVQMALNYSEWNDGFPDLALVDEASVRFVEVKSPGDSLRRNQLVTINRLKKVGFDAEVVRVDWVMDPNQVYTVVDIETTGGTKHTHRITEIGAVKVVAGEVVERWQSLVNPQRHIPSFITQLTGISDQMVEDAPAFSEIANKLSVFLEGSIFVAHNANFDYGFIKTEYERLGEEFSMPKLCTVKEMKRHYPGYESYGLSKLCAVLDINLNQHHRALCDAEATAQLLIMINHKRFS
jgi:DNA polymerase-3 subunit epsilon